MRAIERPSNGYTQYMYSISIVKTMVNIARKFHSVKRKIIANFYVCMSQNKSKTITLQPLVSSFLRICTRPKIHCECECEYARVHVNKL